MKYKYTIFTSSREYYIEGDNVEVYKADADSSYPSRVTVSSSEGEVEGEVFGQIQAWFKDKIKDES